MKIILYLCFAVASAQAIGQNPFDAFEQSFDAATSTTFGHEPTASLPLKSVFVTKDYVAHLIQVETAKGAPTLNISISNEAIDLDSVRWAVHTAALDCSVNQYCPPCDGGGFGRMFCEGKRGVCAAANAPRIAVCSLEKSLNDKTLASATPSGGDLSLEAQASQLSFWSDPSLQTLKVQSTVAASGEVSNLTLSTSLFPLAGIFAGCPVAPTVHVPAVGVRVSNAQLPIDSSINIKAGGVAPFSLDVSLQFNKITLQADVDTGNIGSWIKNSPMAVLGCPLPTLAGFVFATQIHHRSIPWTPPVQERVLASLILKKGGVQIPVQAYNTTLALGVREVGQ